MPISYSFLALRIAYLAKINKAKRFTISEKNLKTLAQNKVLAISYLHGLKVSLEELGYFFGNLEGGGYGLFPIQSLQNAPALTISASHKALFESYDKEQLKQEYYGKGQEQKIEENNLAAIVVPNIMALLWDALIALAIKKETIICQDLAKKIGLTHQKSLEKPLKNLTVYCTENRIPRLDYLVVVKNTGFPPGIKNGANLYYKEIKENIYLHDWTTVSNPFTGKGESIPP